MTWELSEDSETSQGRKSGRTSFGHSQINLRKFLRKAICFQGGQPTAGISYRDVSIILSYVIVYGSGKNNYMDIRVTLV